MSHAVPSSAVRVKRTRISLVRVGILAVAIALVSWTGVHTLSVAISRPINPGPTGFAAYVDVTVTPTYPFETPAGPAQSNVILAFVTAGTAGGCVPMWGGAYTLDEASSQLQLDRRVAQLRLTGGQAQVSFGGQRGDELSTTCTDPRALLDGYKSVVDRYQLRSIDLDLEGATLGNNEAMVRRATAMKALQLSSAAAGRPLSVWLTLPVSPAGLTNEGLAAVTTMLAAGVDLTGVNGMTMNFGNTTSLARPESDTVISASKSLQAQLSAAYVTAGQSLSNDQVWAKVGITPMIGQNDVATERFTIADAVQVNTFARAQGVGQLSMWSLNRDSTCTAPLPSVLSVVQTSCSGVEQGDQSFAVVLSQQGDGTPFLPNPSGNATASATPSPSDGGNSNAGQVDDPAHSPFPVWDPLGTYPAGTKIVWHHQVYLAKYWTVGNPPDLAVTNAASSPWTLLGPVLPGDTPAPLPSLPTGTYPQWEVSHVYVAGSRVLVGNVPYQAKWWTQGQQPGQSAAGGTPWVLVTSGA